MADVISGFRQVVQDLLVPELKAVQVELKHHTEQLGDLRKEIGDLRKQMESMQQQMSTVMTGQSEILSKLDIDKRVTKLETLMEQLLRKAG